MAQPRWYPELWNGYVSACLTRAHDYIIWCQLPLTCSMQAVEDRHPQSREGGLIG